MRVGVQALLVGADGDPEQREDILFAMDAELRDLQRVVDNVVLWRALENGTLRLRPQRVRPAPWVGTVCQQWRQHPAYSGLTWDVRSASSLPVVDIDVEHMRQAVDNVLANVIGTADAVGCVSVTTDRDGDDICVTLRGPTRSLNRDGDVFVPFANRGEYGRFPRHVGLGMAVARGVVSAHGGRVEVLDGLADDPTSGVRIWLPPGQLRIAS